jgi:hypothetical protein
MFAMPNRPDCRRRSAALLAAMLWLAAAAAGRAEVKLLDHERWRVWGINVDDENADWPQISVRLDGEPVGQFALVRVEYRRPEVGPVEVYTITGNGLLRPALPPPGAPGAKFHLASYRDCDAGLTPGLQITRLTLQTHQARASRLVLRGRAANHDSLEANDLMIRIRRPRLNRVEAYVTHSLVATRDFCVDSTRHSLRDVFRLGGILTRYIDHQDHDNDQLRYIVRYRVCTPDVGCFTWPIAYCVTLENQPGYLLDRPPRLNRGPLSAVHTDRRPRETPTLTIRYLRQRSIQPQGFVFATDEAGVDNVEIWGNWPNARTHYQRGDLLGRFTLRLQATRPAVLHCDLLL